MVEMARRYKLSDFPEIARIVRKHPICVGASLAMRILDMGRREFRNAASAGVFATVVSHKGARPRYLVEELLEFMSIENDLSEVKK